MFCHCMYLAVEDRQGANPFLGCLLSDEWSPYHYVKKLGSANQPKEKNMEKVGTVQKRIH